MWQNHFFHKTWDKTLVFTYSLLFNVLWIIMWNNHVLVSCVDHNRRCIETCSTVLHVFCPMFYEKNGFVTLSTKHYGFISFSMKMYLLQAKIFVRSNWSLFTMYVHWSLPTSLHAKSPTSKETRHSQMILRIFRKQF
jgi:hypothetical protein